MDFKEWWGGSGMVRGESIFRNCWNAALETAAKACEARFSDHYPHSGKKIGAEECAEILRKMIEPPR